jgi:hypothetical protein
MIVLQMKFNPLKPNFLKVIFNNVVRSAKKTPHFTDKKIKLLMLLKEIIAVYSEKYMKHINTK